MMDMKALTQSFTLNEMRNMPFKRFPRKRTYSDESLQAMFANGFAILSQTNSSASRRLTKCYVPKVSA